MKSFQKHLGFLAIPVLLVLAVIVAALFQGTVLALPLFWRIVFSFVVSFVPSLLWLYFFYLQDRYEKEPKNYLVGIFILGGLLAYAVSMPLERLMEVGTVSVGGSEWLKLVQYILLVGCIQEFSKFLAVRYTVYNSREFNEPADGIIYAAAAGLGFAAVYNYVYCVSLDSMNIPVVVQRVVEQNLVSAVFAGVMGFFMGQAKFEARYKELTMIAGFLLAAVLNGLYGFLNDWLQGLEFAAWKNLALSAVMATLVYGVLYLMLQHALGESKFKKTTA